MRLSHSASLVPLHLLFFFFNDTATTEIYTLSLHDALPISSSSGTNGTAWVASTSVRAPTARLAASTSAIGAARPDCIWTRLNATSVVLGETWTASSGRGTVLMRTPRWRCATRSG